MYRIEGPSLMITVFRGIVFVELDMAVPELHPSD
jgi:hypothetical protein